jgi:hypothetical protein
MNAYFFGLALLAAVSPKLLGMDLLMMENRRPRAMFFAFLAGALGVSIPLGLLDVLVFRIDAVNGQVSVAAATDLILGLPLLVAGALVATGRAGGRRRTGTREPKAPKDSWAQRALREPRLVIAAVIGAICGLPGALYATGLKHLVTGTSPAAAQIIGVILFNLIMFSLVLIPFALLEARPEATKRRLQGSSDWLLGHARQLIAYTALAVGAYMVINGAAHLLG